MIREDCYWNRYGKCHVLAVKKCSKRCTFFETEEDYQARQERFRLKHEPAPENAQQNTPQR